MTSSAPRNDIHSLEGFVSRACDTPASSGSDDNNCAKLPDFNICFNRTGSSRSHKFPAPAKPTPSAEPNRPQGNKPPFKFAGIIVSMIGSLCFCTSALTIKLFPENSPYGLQEKLRAVFVRGMILMICCGASLYMEGSTIKVPRDEIWVNVARSLLGCCGTIGGYLALCYISLGDGAALIFSSPVWTSLLSHFLLGEPLSWILLVALPFSLVGIILIAHPALILDLFVTSDLAEAPMFAELNSTLFNDDALELSFGEIDDVVPSNLADGSTSDNRWIGVCIALATSLCVSGVYIILKFRRTTKIQTTTFWLGFVTSIEGFIALCIVGFGDIPSLEEAGLLFVNGFFSWIGQTCLQWGLFYENASILSVVRTSEVAMSFTLSALLLDDEIYWTSVLGATIIALVVVLMILNNWLSNKPEQLTQGDNEEIDEKEVKNNINKTNNDKTICAFKKKRCSSNS